ncbi:LacI family DNA-binding transcriptional regulator [Nonomuraea sp. NPDC004702]
MTVTLADATQACGLSPSTVSRALSDPGGVSARTRDKVAAHHRLRPPT